MLVYIDESLSNKSNEPMDYYVRSPHIRPMDVLLLGYPEK